ncbi:MAG: tetratricopeptide repeat protein [Bradymonadia bacterium]
MDVTTPDVAEEKAQAAPDDVHAQIAAAYACDAAGRQRAALEYYRRAAHLGIPEGLDRPFMIQFGAALTQNGLWPEAIHVLQVALARWPEHRGLKCYLALALHQGGHHDAAIGELLGVALSGCEHMPDLKPHAWDLAGWEAELLMSAVNDHDGHLALEEIST